MSFDLDTFMNSVTNEAGSTVLEPVPVGEYPATVDDLKPRNTKTGRLILDVIWNIEDDDLRAQLHRERVTVRQSVFIDTTPAGAIDFTKGKNVQLNRVREALGQNKEGEAWSPMQLRGAGPARITVSQRIDDDTGNVYNDVKQVGRW
jgi:hypothetical protein